MSTEPNRNPPDEPNRILAATSSPRGGQDHSDKPEGPGAVTSYLYSLKEAGLKSWRRCQAAYGRLSAAFGLLRDRLAVHLRPIFSVLPRWWYGALIPEWPGFFMDDPRSIARYVSPKAAQWIPMVTARFGLAGLKKKWKVLRTEEEGLKERLQMQPSEVLERQLGEVGEEIEAVRRELREVRREIVRNIYDTLARLMPPIRYALDPYSGIRVRQTIRTPGEILESLREGTCVDLAALFCGLCLSQKLLPILVLLRDPDSRERHVLAVVSLDEDFEDWDAPDRYGRDTIAKDRLEPPRGGSTLAAWVDDGHFLAVECTGFASLACAPAASGRVNGRFSFDQAAESGRKSLENSRKFLYALDVATAQNSWGLAPYEPRRIFGERRLAQIRRHTITATVCAITLIAMLAYGYTVTYRQAEEMEGRILRADLAQIRDQAESGWWLVRWLATGRLKARLANEWGPETTNARKSDLRSRAAFGVYALSDGADRSSLFQVLGGPTWYHPQARAYTIMRLPSQRLTATDLAGWLDDKEVVGSDRVRQAIVLAIGNCPEPLPQSVIASLQELYLKDQDPGVHSSAEWVLRRGWPGEGTRWVAQQLKLLREKGIDRLKEKGMNPRERQWFVDKPTGLTMVYFPAAPEKEAPPAKGSNLWFFEIGDLSRDTNYQMVNPMAIDPVTDPTRIPVAIIRGFAVATIETPRGVLDMMPYDAILMTDESPASLPISTTWFDATMFCNRRNEQGVAPCYVDASQGGLKATSLAAQPFSDASYRLPSEAEWEYAARGLSLDPYCFGVDTNTLSNYASARVSDSLGPIASHMPNDFGLFDVHGSLEEWCNDEAVARSTNKYHSQNRLPAESPLVNEPGVTAIHTTRRACRGGSLHSSFAGLTAYARNPHTQLFRALGNVQGFRLAMTLDGSRWWPAAQPPSIESTGQQPAEGQGR